MSEGHIIEENKGTAPLEIKTNLHTVACRQKTAEDFFFKSVLSKEVKCWPEFYKYAKRLKGYGENIPAMKD